MQAMPTPATVSVLLVACPMNSASCPLLEVLVFKQLGLRKAVLWKFIIRGHPLRNKKGVKLKADL